jgi:hypothetical protein
VPAEDEVAGAELEVDDGLLDVDDGFPVVEVEPVPWP